MASSRTASSWAPDWVVGAFTSDAELAPITSPGEDNSISFEAAGAVEEAEGAGDGLEVVEVVSEGGGGISSACATTISSALASALRISWATSKRVSAGAKSLAGSSPAWANWFNWL